MRFLFTCVAAAWTLACCLQATAADDVSVLRLVPFPKEVQRRAGTFPLRRNLSLELPADVAGQLGRLIAAELQRAALPVPHVQPGAGNRLVLRLAAPHAVPFTPIELASDMAAEGYLLEVTPNGIVGVAAGPAGVFYAVQTLCQLIRANRHGDDVPCLTIKDWPALRWRCFQDDLTRGPSSTLATLKFEVAQGAQLKMNLFTYYMEYQYAFKKHPIIGPTNGSLTPETLTELVHYGKQWHVEILGNQQSFGHFARILRHPQYAHLRETPSLLCPVNEASYQLLDDFYSEVCPLLPFPYFNVCCDETDGLGTGPSKELADKIGVGGVYVRHIRRIHDLLERKYGKRMMMWGDIILQHPEQLSQIPKDTIMLTWGYDDRPNREQQIIPFAESGFQFFVCPGVSNWSRILPDFGTASANIQSFVHAGAKHGALGMLNTAWEDDGEALNAPKWHGYAWGAECAWNAAATPRDQFNRRIGAVLFGEPGDHFGQAIELLAQTHRLPTMQGMRNARFWQDDLPPSAAPAAVRASAHQLLAIVRPAIDHLTQCQAQATVNQALLDGFLFGAQRMELIGQRMLDGLQAAELYNQACQSSADRAQALLSEVAQLVTKNRHAHELLGRRFAQLWLRESKPYALDWTMQRYHKVVEQYAELTERLAAAKRALETGGSLPAPANIGLALAESPSAP